MYMYFMNIDEFLKLKHRNILSYDHNVPKYLKSGIDQMKFNKLVKKMCTKLFQHQIYSFMNDCLKNNYDLTHEQFNNLLDSINHSGILPNRNIELNFENTG